MSAGQRAAVLRASWAGLLLIVAVIAWTYTSRTTLFVNTYQVNVNVRTVTQPEAVEGEVQAARTFVTHRLAASGFVAPNSVFAVSVTPEADATGALSGRSIGVQTIAFRSIDHNALAQIPALLGAKYDLRADDSGRVDYDAATQIVIVGPFILFGPTDTAFFLEIALLVVAFGAMEVRRADPAAYPAGMHPIIVFCEIALIGALGVTLIALRQHSPQPLLPGYVAILLLANAALVRWLWVSRAKWSGLLRGSYWSVVTALVLIDTFNALTLLSK
jgi:hypothetical protein